MRRTPHKWYNMQYINMSGNLPMVSAANAPQVRYSAAYPTGRERGLRRGNYCVTLTVSEGSDPKNTHISPVKYSAAYSTRRERRFNV